MGRRRRPTHRWSGPSVAPPMHPSMKTFTDMAAAPLTMTLQQSVKKANDRGKEIPDVRPPLYNNESGVTVFFAGNGLFPLFLEVTTAAGSSIDLTDAGPPAVHVYSYREMGPPRQAEEVSTHDWSVPAFRRVSRDSYVVKLSFKKAIGAGRFFFLTLGFSVGDKHVTLSSELFKIATKPRKMVVGDLPSHYTPEMIREMCPDLYGRPEPKASGRKRAKSRVSDVGPVDITKEAITPSARSYALMFRTPSRCLTFFAEHFFKFYNISASCHLVPKRPGKMQPPSGLHHEASLRIQDSDGATSVAVGTAPAIRTPSLGDCPSSVVRCPATRSGSSLYMQDSHSAAGSSAMLLRSSTAPPTIPTAPTAAVPRSDSGCTVVSAPVAPSRSRFVPASPSVTAGEPVLPLVPDEPILPDFSALSAFPSVDEGVAFPLALDELSLGVSAPDSVPLQRGMSDVSFSFFDEFFSSGAGCGDVDMEKDVAGGSSIMDSSSHKRQLEGASLNPRPTARMRVSY